MMTQHNVTLVAFYGAKKPEPLATLIEKVSGEMERALRTDYPQFEAFSATQIHATLIGMEVDIVGGQFYGHWLAANRNGGMRAVDFKTFMSILKRVSLREPMFTIRFAGFRRAHCTCVGKSTEGWNCSTSRAEFHSCDRSAYDGSFYAYTPGPVILTGWQVRAADQLSDFPRHLYDLRFAAESAGFVDKYHSDSAPHWMDDDCYLKLGAFKGSIEGSSTDWQEDIREYLSCQEPVTVDIVAEDVSIVLYENPSLSCVKKRLTLPEAVEDPGKVVELYEELRRL